MMWPGFSLGSSHLTQLQQGFFKIAVGGFFIFIFFRNTLIKLQDKTINHSDSVNEFDQRRVMNYKQEPHQYSCLCPH